MLVQGADLMGLRLCGGLTETLPKRLADTLDLLGMASRREPHTWNASSFASQGGRVLYEVFSVGMRAARKSATVH